MRSGTSSADADASKPYEYIDIGVATTNACLTEQDGCDWGWLDVKGSGLDACYELVMKDDRCNKDYFTYATRSDENCGCKTSDEALQIYDQDTADYYKILASGEGVYRFAMPNSSAMRWKDNDDGKGSAYTAVYSTLSASCNSSSTNTWAFNDLNETSCTGDNDVGQYDVCPSNTDASGIGGAGACYSSSSKGGHFILDLGPYCRFLSGMELSLNGWSSQASLTCSGGTLSVDWTGSVSCSGTCDDNDKISIDGCEGAQKYVVDAGGLFYAQHIVVVAARQASSGRRGCPLIHPRYEGHFLSGAQFFVVDQVVVVPVFVVVPFLVAF